MGSGTINEEKENKETTHIVYYTTTLSHFFIFYH